MSDMLGTYDFDDFDDDDYEPDPPTDQEMDEAADKYYAELERQAEDLRP